MEQSKSDFVNKTVLTTPKPTACSTVMRKSFKKNPAASDTISENSLGIIEELSSSDISYQLQYQRNLASNSLQRANKVSAIPSKYLRSNATQNNSSFGVPNESTISDSDLLKTPVNTSTPRSSIDRLSVGQSLAELSYKISNTDISLDKFVNDFKVAMKGTDIEATSSLFTPAEQAKSMLMADELSWRLKHDFPVQDEQFSQFNASGEKISMGEFFRMRSDTLSDLSGAKSPVKTKNPVPLISESQISEDQNQSVADDMKHKSLSISAIQQFLAQNEDTPRRALDHLLKQGSKSEVSTKSEDISILVSNNSSDCSSHSDNEAIRCIVDKENVNTLNVSLKVPRSQAPALSPTRKYWRAPSPPQKGELSLERTRFNKENVNTLNVSFKAPTSPACSPTRISSRAPSPLQNGKMPSERTRFNKENVNTLIVSPNIPRSLSPASSSSSRNSSRASSAMTSLQNGKLPIETTKCDMIWGCVKVGKSFTQDFLIRNRSSKRLGLKLSLSGQDFKLRKENRIDSEPVSSTKIILHPHEAKILIISFIPTKVGAAVDELLFTSLDPSLQQTKKQCMRFFGYGGSGKVEFRSLTRDTMGKFWLPLGKLETQNKIKQSFSVKSTGVLPTFVHASFTSKDFARVSVVPSFFVLIPNEQKEVVVSYEFTGEDHKLLQKSLANTVIFELGSLSITSGTEVDRGRLRRLCRKCSENGKYIDRLATVLKETIAGEVMPPDLVRFKESPEYWKDIFKQFTKDEVVITVERDPDQTIIPQFSDDSGLYQSLWQDSTGVVSERTAIMQSCRLEPSTIILTPPSKMRDCLFLISERSKNLQYEVSSMPEGLEIEPKKGVIKPGAVIVINLAYTSPAVSVNKHFKVLVYVESEAFEADVKVMVIGKSKNNS